FHVTGVQTCALPISGAAVPIAVTAVYALGRRDRLQWQAPAYLIQCGHGLQGVLRLRADTQRLDARGRQFAGLVKKIQACGRLGLDTVEGQERLAFACLHRQAVGILDTAELAGVFFQAEMTRGETAR